LKLNVKQPDEHYHFDSHYREQVMLKDGTQVTLRMIIPADKLLLAHGMDNFSPESRYQRFLGARKSFNEADLRYLTEIDGIDHTAIGALLHADEGIGVARFVRFGNERDVAEPAIAVLDAYQKKGLGRILFTRLMTAAHERGIRRFHGSMLASNQAMRHLLQSIDPAVRLHTTDHLIEFELSLDKSD
jgi:GNAT superfamily N-acetyltransferase